MTLTEFLCDTDCQSCTTPVLEREAVIRSSSFTRVYWHRHCWEKVHGPLVALAVAS